MTTRYIGNTPATDIVQWGVKAGLVTFPAHPLTAHEVDLLFARENHRRWRERHAKRHHGPDNTQTPVPECQQLNAQA